MTTFVKVDDPTNLIRICEQRLPLSVSIYNQLLSFHKFGKILEVYVFGSGVNEEDTWILIKWLRPDWNFWTSISAPRSMPEHHESTLQVRKALATSGVIDWKVHSLFSPMEKMAAKMVLLTYVDELDRVWSVRSWQLFYMKPEDALKLDIEVKDPNVRVGRLNVEQGVPFLTDNWHYRYISSRENVNEAVRKCIEGPVTGGVYVKNDKGEETLVCGAVFAGNGQLGMLHTLSDHRRKGYAGLVTKYIFKEMAKQGLHPCVGGELGNDAAVNMYAAIKGLNSVDKLTFIYSEPSVWK